MKNILLITGLILSFSTLAQDNNYSNANTKPYASFITVGQKNLTPDAAKENGVGEQVFHAEYALQYESEAVLVAGGIGLLQFDDNATYDVEVVNLSNGDESSKEAKASGFNLFFEIGHRFQKDMFKLDLLAGYDFISAERSVSNCSDCPSESIELDSGFYIKPRVGFYANEKISIDLSYVKYPSADVDDNIQLSLSFKHGN